MSSTEQTIPLATMKDVNAGHTPGPWQTFQVSKGIALIGVTPTAAHLGDVAHCAPFDQFRAEDEVKANARLIAAAPDMLAALKAMDTHWSDDGFDGPDSKQSMRFSEETLNVWRAIRAAIAKATA